MHLMKDHEDYIMYGDAIVKTGKNPEKLLPNAFYGSKAFTDYVRKDIDKTKEAAMKATIVNKIRKNNTTNNHKILNTRDIYSVIDGKAYAPELIRMIHIDQAVPGYEFTITPNPMYAVENTLLAIEDVIFNPPATIVFWGDGSKTVVKCQDGEEFDPEKGLTMTFFKKMHGNKGHYFEEIKKWTHKYAMSLFKDEVHTMKDEKIEEVVEAGMSKPTDTVWVLFYARADRGEDEGYTQHPVVYKHKSSAVRAAKRLISKLPNGVHYEWFVDEK